MKAKIGFLAMIIGSAGLDGEQTVISAVIAMIGLLIIVKESKKIDAPPASKNVY